MMNKHKNIKNRSLVILRRNIPQGTFLIKINSLIPLPLTERQIFRKLGFEKGGQGVEPRSERW